MGEDKDDLSSHLKKKCEGVVPCPGARSACGHPRSRSLHAVLCQPCCAMPCLLCSVQGDHQACGGKHGGAVRGGGHLLHGVFHWAGGRRAGRRPAQAAGRWQARQAGQALWLSLPLGAASFILSAICWLVETFTVYSLLLQCLINHVACLPLLPSDVCLNRPRSRLPGTLHIYFDISV